MHRFEEAETSRAKAKELQDGARDSGASDMLREAIEAWVDTPVHASVAQLHSPTAAKFVEEDDESEGGPRYIRNLLSKTMLVEMCDSKLGRANVRNDKLLGEALDRMEGWTRTGHVRRTVQGKAVKWRFYQRDLSTNDEWIPAPETNDPEIEDLLG